MYVYLVCQGSWNGLNILMCYFDCDAAVNYAKEYVDILNRNGSEAVSGLTQDDSGLQGPGENVVKWVNRRDSFVCVSKIAAAGRPRPSELRGSAERLYNNNQLSDLEFEAIYDTD